MLYIHLHHSLLSKHTDRAITKSNSKQLVHRQETENSAFCVLLATAKLLSKVGMTKSNTQLFRLAVQCAEDHSSRKVKLYK